jgi:hypothetical protein
MWIDILTEGLVRIITPIGPRYIELTFWQRVSFLWIFRHFDKLPQQVLSARQQRMIDALCAEQRLLALPSRMNGTLIIGTLERVPLKQVEEELPQKGPSGSVGDAGTTSPLVPDWQQRQ